MLSYRSLAAGVAAVVLVLSSCSDSGGSPPEKASTKPAVYVVNYPLQYFAERIGGDLIEVHFPAPKDVDPAYWEPDAATIRQYQQAALILLNGAGYARWVEKASLPAARMVNTLAGYKDQLIGVEGALTHSHGPEGEHAHAGLASTTWLDPALAEAHAGAVANALAKLLPGSSAEIQQRHAALQSDLKALGESLTAGELGYRGAPLLGSHPVYQYLARASGLNLRQMHWEPNETPSAEEWSKLDALLRDHQAKWMIWEAPPLAETTAALAQRGIQPLIFYTVGAVPDSGDYLSVMAENIDRLKSALQ